ncbi:Histidine phosphatase superfamily clade-2 [Penicillium hispanicum]|uniref:Histidine phosphatase superfamily clade-2 n=1 Tax=Penicillium hispanicum TaxID=1080232 RepID=UPI002540CBF2|nr:Histidine phosphatase superfamily clade-2 [Penicillium hispanicum]KAJ5587287.1 Histidine phosphatase superfamily clade-2 [Penicillium hispanicum]
MRPSRQLLAIVALILPFPALIAAQDYTETVWGVFAYTIHGDNTPDVLAGPRPRSLSDYGASQLLTAGSAFRARYVASAGTSNSTESAIQYISSIILDSRDVSVLSTTEQYDVASAIAFMQGLYPPPNLSNSTEALANGSTYTSPFNGYQYPQIMTLGEADPQSVLVAGSAECDMHQAAEYEYQVSNEAQEIIQETDGFYANLWHLVLSGVYDESSATYANAVDISDYVEYEALHNKTALMQLSTDDIRRARWLADRYTWATNAQDTTSSNQSFIGAASPIAGQTLAASIAQAFNLNIEAFGTQQKMTLLFGSDEPAVALASLIGLASDRQPNFYSRPAKGASLVFELFSFEADEVDPSYPGSDNLYVRFFLHNGTDSATKFTPYPLFGNGPSQTYMRYSEFESELETFSVQSTQEWCLRCNSPSLFCTGVLESHDSAPKGKKRMAPAVAGVIGAVIMLAIIGTAAAIGFFLCGLRKRMGHKPSTGGFKGNDKLASDTDVSFRNPIWGMSKTAEAGQQDELAAGEVIARGHERVGSWELGQAKNGVDDLSSTGHRHMSAWRDEIEEEWRQHSGLQPVKVRESI